MAIIIFKKKEEVIIIIDDDHHQCLSSSLASLLFLVNITPRLENGHLFFEIFAKKNTRLIQSLTQRQPEASSDC